MQRYVQEMHDAFRKKVAKMPTRKVGSMRLRDNGDVTNSLIDVASSLESKGCTLILSAKGKTTLPSYTILRGFELLELRDKILNEAGRALVMLDIFDERR